MYVYKGYILISNANDRPTYYSHEHSNIAQDTKGSYLATISRILVTSGVIGKIATMIIDLPKKNILYVFSTFG